MSTNYGSTENSGILESCLLNAVKSLYYHFDRYTRAARSAGPIVLRVLTCRLNTLVRRQKSSVIELRSSTMLYRHCKPSSPPRPTRPFVSTRCHTNSPHEPNRSISSSASLLEYLQMLYEQCRLENYMPMAHKRVLFPRVRQKSLQTIPVPCRK